MEYIKNKNYIKSVDLVEYANNNNLILVKQGEFYQLQDIIYSPLEIAQRELLELEQWFEKFYAPKEQKLRRLNTLQIYTDDLKQPYNELLILYNEAETKRKRIQELEAIIG